jgi:chemotaxis protein methyltransferase CheR
MSSISLQEGGAYQVLQMVLQDEFGIVVGEDQSNSITEKLTPVLAEFSLGSLDALVDEIRNGDAVDLRNSVLHAITTREDEWFEPKELFDLLDDYLLPDMLGSGRDNYRIWVIGANAGQLPYSLAMKINQAIRDTNSSTRVTIEATDVSDVVMHAAARGIYEKSSMEGMQEAYQKKHMDEQAGRWHVDDEIKSMIAFSTCNLHDDFEDKGHFDLILCLDVLAYFSVPVKTRLLDSFSNLLDPSGILIAGMNEPVLPFNSNFEMVRHADGIFYRQKSD